MVVQAAERALQIDPTLSMPYAALAMAKQNEKTVDWAKSLELSGKAIEADPKNATAYLWRSIAWLNLGFFEKAIADQDSCLRVDPAYQNCTRWKAQSFIYIGNDKQALALFERGVASGFIGNRAYFFVPAMVRSGDTLAARLLLDRLDVQPELNDILIRELSNPGPSRIDAKAILAKYDASITQSTRAELNRPIIYLWLGDFDTASELAATGNNANDEILSWQPDRPGWRNSAGFKQMLHKTGVFAYWQKHSFPPHCHAVGANDFTCDAP